MAYPSDLTRTKNWGTETLTDADLEGQLDLIINWAMAVVNSSTGHTHDGTSNQGPKINITNLTVGSQAQGDIIYASSGSAWARLGAGTAGYLLKTQGAGANPAWVNIAADTTYLPAGTVLQVVSTQTGAAATASTTIANDDSIPQNTEGTELMTRAITPISATNKLKITVTAFLGSDAADYYAVALFQDSTADALACGYSHIGTNQTNCITFTHYMTSGTTSSTTFKVRTGSAGGSAFRFNGQDGAGRKYGGVAASSIVIEEIKV